MSKIPLLLAPGTLCDSRIWQHQIDNLSDIAEISVVDTTTVDSLSALAEKVLSTAPDKFALAGFSFGGILAFEIFRQASHRISHLALISTNARADNVNTRSAKLAQIDMANELGLESMIRNMLIPHYFSPLTKNRKDMERLVLSMAEGFGLSVFKDQIACVMERPDSRTDLSNIKCPTLVLFGQGDIVCPPKRHHEIAIKIPHAIFRGIEHCGHMSTMEYPEEVTDALRNLLGT